MARSSFITTAICSLVLMLLFLILFLGGCIPKTEKANVEEIALEWPGPPQVPMVRWLDEIHDAEDAGIRPGFWRRVGEVLFGKRHQEIVKPYGIHLDSGGRLSVVDTGASMVHFLELTSGGYSFVSETDEGRLVSPIGITSDNQDGLYLTDSWTRKIYRYDREEQAFAAFSSATLQRPTGIVFNNNNWLLYVSDTMAHQVVAIGLDGQERFRFGGRGTGQGQLNFPTDLTIDNNGNIVVTDSMNARIQIFAADGRPLEVFGSRGYAAGYFDKPKGVAVDSDGHIYVCDAMKDTIQVFDPQGRYLLQFGDRGHGAGQFWMPSGIHIDAADKIYVADSYNHRIQIFQYLNSAQSDGG